MKFQVSGMICMTPRAFAEETAALLNALSFQAIDSTRDGGVILGRNATVILAGRPNTIHVLLTGKVEDRVARAAAAAGIPLERAARRQVVEDNVRSEMSQRLYAWNPQDPSRYDLVINTSRIDPSTAVEIIVRAGLGTAA